MGLDLEISRRKGRSLYRQIADALRERIASRALPDGLKLPSTRDLAKQLGVHRRTVVQAYHILESEGWVLSGVGQGTFVAGATPAGASDRGHAAEVGETGTPLGSAFNWDAVIRQPPGSLADPWRLLTQEPLAGDAIRFTGATPDPASFPAGEFREIVDEVFRTHGSSVLEYGPPEGLHGLREWVATRLRGRGIETTPDAVLIVTGSQQGLDLAARLLLSDGDAAVVEEPGYSNGFRLFQAHGARVFGVPIDEGGIDLEALDRVCRSQTPRLLYLMPIFQNPTGMTLQEDRIGALLEIAARHGVPVVEDQFDADLCYDGAPPAPLKARDRDGRVIFLGSFSKILFPGLRLGWMVIPRSLQPMLRELKQMADFSSGLLAQHAMEIFCRRGDLDRHLARVRRIYGARLRTMLSCMERAFPDGVRWTRPRGGLTLWVSLPPGWDSIELLHAARREGVDFSPGPLFFPNGGGRGFLRLSYIRETEERIATGIRILGGLLKDTPARAASAASAGPFI